MGSDGAAAGGERENERKEKEGENGKDVHRKGKKWKTRDGKWPYWKVG